MKAYLVQGEAARLAHFSRLESSVGRLFTLSYDTNIPSDKVLWTRHIYAPNTTWAEGRNILLETARRHGLFEYFVFFDDDAIFEWESFCAFEAYLDEHTPQIALPLCDRVMAQGFWDPQAQVQRPVALDQIVQAFHKSVVDDGVVLPNDTTFDHVSWWYGAEINQYLILTRYAETTVQLNFFRVHNDRHLLDLPKDDRGSSTYRGGIEPKFAERVRRYVEREFESGRAAKRLQVGIFAASPLKRLVVSLLPRKASLLLLRVKLWVLSIRRPAG